MSKTTQQPAPAIIPDEVRAVSPSPEWQAIVTDGARFHTMPAGPEKAELATSLMKRGFVDPLIDKSGQWRKGTFLFDSTGNVTPAWKEAFTAATRQVMEAHQDNRMPQRELKEAIVTQMRNDKHFDNAYMAQQAAGIQRQ